MIRVDRPEVYTRERLVNDRLEQQRWLQAQLARTDDLKFGVEGISDIRSFLGVSSATSVQANPMAIDLYQANLANEIENLSLAQQLERLDQEKQRLVLEKEIADLRGGSGSSGSSETTVTSAGAAAEAGDSGGTGNANAAAVNGNENSGEVASPTGATPPAATNRLDAILGRMDDYFLDPSEASRADVDVSPIDVFRDRLAYREEVRNAIVENSLDDAHDLAGSTLYRLKFDATVIPGHDTSALAAIEIRIKPPAYAVSSCAPVLQQVKDIYDLWTEAMSDFARNEADRVFFAGTTEEQARLNADARAEIFAAGATPSEDLDVNLEAIGASAGTDADTEHRRLVNQHMEEKYVARGLGEYLDISTDEVTGSFVVSEKAGADRDEALVAFCDKLQASTSVYSYAVTPKESVQRVSDVASRREVMELSMALGVLTGGIGLENLTEFAEASQGIFQAIRRQPVVVGYSGGNGENYFGWILGPRFEITPDAKSVNFRHRVAQESMSALVSLPAWWRDADIQVRTGWILETNSLYYAGTDETGARRPVIDWDDEVASYPVRLPGSLVDIFDLLNVLDSRQPLVSNVVPAAMDIGKPAQVVIQGTNLWRTPLVTLDAQRADTVTILPSMNGLIATFDRVAQPAGWAKDQTDGYADLWVWTSEGGAYAWPIELYRTVAAAPVRMAPTLASSRIVGGFEAVLSVPAGSIPAAYDSIRIGVRRERSDGEFFMTDTSQVNRPDNELRFVFTNAQLETTLGAAEVVDGMGLEVAVFLRPSPGDTARRYVASKPAIYYKTAAAARATLAQTSAPNLPARSSLTLPAGFARAFDGYDFDDLEIAAAVRGNSAIVLEVTKGPRQGRAVPFTIGVRADHAAAWAEAHKTAQVIELTIVEGPDGLGIAAPQITVPAATDSF